jgi:hypothetical protein
MYENRGKRGWGFKVAKYNYQIYSALNTSFFSKIIFFPRSANRDMTLLLKLKELSYGDGVAILRL